MHHPDFVIFYVDNPLTSAGFYSELLNIQPVETAPTFVLFVFESGLKFGLWSRDTVEPQALVGSAGTAELVISAPSADAVHALYDNWKNRGLTFLQLPTEMDFGLTFVALDPDGHRLRVYVRVAV